MKRSVPVATKEGSTTVDVELHTPVGWKIQGGSFHVRATAQDSGDDHRFVTIAFRVEREPTEVDRVAERLEQLDDAGFAVEYIKPGQALVNEIVAMNPNPHRDPWGSDNFLHGIRVISPLPYADIPAENTYAVVPRNGKA